MIDNFSILLSHGLLMLTFWLLIQRDDCDSEAPPEPDAEPEGFAHSRINMKQAKKPSPKNPMRRKPAARNAGGQQDA